MQFWKSFFNQTNQQNISTIKDQEFYNMSNFLKTITHNNKIVEIYISQDRNINLQDIENLCVSVGWVKRPMKKVRIALDNSFLIITLYYFTANKKQIIGFARATSDHTFNATIWDVVINPDFQGYGLGKLLLLYLVNHLRKSDISTITLFADCNVVDFYTKLGFMIDPDNTKGMFWYPK
jgi:aralkylamine N-acetyltransferase